MIARPAAAACVGVLLATVAGCVSTASPAAAPSSAPAPAPSAGPADSRTPLQILAAGIPTDTSAAYHFSIGDMATKLPFTAALDAKGRLTTASVVMPATATIPAFTYKFVYQYTAVTAPTAPTGTTKAIPDVYKWIGY
jgi:hypothetical protein